jgi:hypothetical protein
MKQSEEWRFGREVEEYVISWRKRQGLWIIRTHAIRTGGAPMLEGWYGKDILPDIILGRDGNSSLLEIKGKSRITRNNKYQRDEHGIPLNNWQSYIRVSEKLGMACALGFYDAGIADEQRGLPGYPHCYYEASLENAAKAMREARDPGTLQSFGEPMGFFDMRYFEKTSLTDAPGKPTPLAPFTVRPWETKRAPPQEGHQAPLGL